MPVLGSDPSKISAVVAGNNMATSKHPPLSPTVTLVFEQFLKKLEDEKVLGPAAQEALAKALAAQKLDPDSLRQAILTAEEPKS